MNGTIGIQYYVRLAMALIFKIHENPAFNCLARDCCGGANCAVVVAWKKFMIALFLGIFSLIGMFIWAGLMLLAQSLSGMGDGISGGSSRESIVLGWGGCLYLFLVFVCCFTFMRGYLLLYVGVAAHIVLAFFAFDILAEGGLGGIIILIPFGCFAAGWHALYKSRLMK